MKISVVVPVYNATSMIQNCMSSLIAQARPADEIIFVDNGSTDASAAVMREFISGHPSFNIRLLHETKRGAAAARNRALKEVSGEIIAFTDADSFPREDWLQKLESFYTAGNWDGIGGAYCFLNPGTTSAKLQALEMEIQAPFAGKIIAEKYLCLFGQILGTGNASYRKKVLEDLGGFDESLFLTGEDMDLTMRAVGRGYRLMSWNLEVVVWNIPRKSLRAYWKRIFEYRVILGTLLRKHYKNEAFIQLPGVGILRFKFPFPVMIMNEFFILLIIFSGSFFLFFIVHAPAVFFLAGLLFFLRMDSRLRVRLKRTGIRASAIEILALSVSDMIKKIFSQCGKIYGAVRARTVVL